MPYGLRGRSFIDSRRSRLSLLQAEVVKAAGQWQELTHILSLCEASSAIFEQMVPGLYVLCRVEEEEILEQCRCASS